MVTTNRVDELFDDAKQMHLASLERLDAGDVRDAAEKAWCATKRSTDALILSRTGNEPETTGGTTEGILALAKTSGTFEALVGQYFTRISYLHGTCFYDGLCGPDTARRVRETTDYIQDAERLAELNGS